MTDNEIIKALECCSDWENGDTCKECPFYEELDCATTDRLDKYALDLINRQKAEIERLEKECKITRAYLHDNGLEWDLLAHNAKVSAISYHGEVISETYTFTVEIETDNIIGAKEQIATALEHIGTVKFPKVDSNEKKG